MSITALLSELGYSDEFIGIIESSMLEDGVSDGIGFSDDDLTRVYDSVSCFIDESSTPIAYNDFSD